MSLKRKNKVLDTEIVKTCKRLEILTYRLIDKWKRQYRYTLVDEFRKHVENLREATICALRSNKNNVNQKLAYYDLSLCSLDNIEYLLEIMVSGSFNIISNNEYADFAIMVDDIGIMVDRLIRSLKNSKKNEDVRTAESQSCDDESDQII